MDKKEQPKDEREYLERIPFVSELLKRIDDISQAIRQGHSGTDEALNLLSDLPDSWKPDIQDSIAKINKEYESKKDFIYKQYIKGTRESFKQHLDNELLNNGKEYSRSIKQVVVNLLDSKGLLFISRRPVPESEFVDLHDLNDTNDQSKKF